MNDPFGMGLTPEMFLGKPTLHLPINMIIQDMGNGKVIGVFQTTQGEALLHGSAKPHQLIIADVFVRPQLVCESDSFAGDGFSSLATHGFVSADRWIGGELFRRDSCDIDLVAMEGGG